VDGAAVDSAFKPPDLPEPVCIVDLWVGPHRLLDRRRLRRRQQRREARHHLRRLEHEVRRAIAVRGLERVAHLAHCAQRQTILRHRRAADVAAQALEPGALAGCNRHARVQLDVA
jgi:hypothetical protein